MNSEKITQESERTLISAEEIKKLFQLSLNGATNISAGNCLWMATAGAHGQTL